ncbi:hypothetical protein ABKN59_010755 [Abortiporus biennis]
MDCEPTLKRKRISQEHSSGSSEVTRSNTAPNPVVLQQMEDNIGQIELIDQGISILEVLRKKAEDRIITSHTITIEDLTEAGLVYELLFPNHPKITEVASGFTGVKSVEELYARLQKIHCTVNLDEEVARRIIVHAILLALPDICSSEGQKIGIVPGFRLAEGIGRLQTVNPITKAKVWVPNQLNYLVVKYDDIKDYTELLLVPGNMKDLVIKKARSVLLLVEGKSEGKGEDYELSDNAPEAICQALALLRYLPRASEIRFCVTDGHKWQFYILKSEEDGKLSDLELRELLVLLREWLSPSNDQDGIFTSTDGN